VESIKANGLLSSIWITKEKTIISGHRRINACKALGISEIEAEVREYSDLLVIEANRYREKSWKEKLAENEAIEKLKGHSHGGNRRSKKFQDQNSDLGRTIQKSAQALGMSHDTLHKVKVIAKEKPELLDRIDAAV
jgi:hypothetical protein